MILLGALIAVWGALVLGFARPLHSGWKELLRGMRRAGVRDSVFGTEWMASEAGLRGMRLAGGLALAAGLALLAAGGVRALLGP